MQDKNYDRLKMSVLVNKQARLHQHQSVELAVIPTNSGVFINIISSKKHFLIFHQSTVVS